MHIRFQTLGHLSIRILTSNSPKPKNNLMMLRFICVMKKFRKKFTACVMNYLYSSHLKFFMQNTPHLSKQFSTQILHFQLPYTNEHRTPFYMRYIIKNDLNANRFTINHLKITCWCLRSCLWRTVAVNRCCSRRPVTVQLSFVNLEILTSVTSQDQDHWQRWQGDQRKKLH